MSIHKALKKLAREFEKDGIPLPARIHLHARAGTRLRDEYFALMPCATDPADRNATEGYFYGMHVTWEKEE